MFLVSIGLEEEIVGAGVVEAGVGVRYRALTILLPNPSPRTTLLNISSNFICRLLDGISFLPFLSCTGGCAGALVVVEEVDRGRGVERKLTFQGQKSFILFKSKFSQ